jgi:hypothetical protein
MDRAMWRRHLAVAERHVAENQRHITHQRQIVAELEQGGYDTSIARALLTQFEATQKLHIEDRDRLQADLSRAEQLPLPLPKP